jgi:hypothetical protein
MPHTAAPTQRIYSGYDPELLHHRSHTQTHACKFKFNIVLPFPSRNRLCVFSTAGREKEPSVCLNTYPMTTLHRC